MLPVWFQVVISADVEPKDLVNKRETEEVDDTHRVLMDDLNITKNSVSILCFLNEKQVDAMFS